MRIDGVWEEGRRPSKIETGYGACDIVKWKGREKGRCGDSWGSGCCGVNVETEVE